MSIFFDRAEGIKAKILREGEAMAVYLMNGHTFRTARLRELGKVRPEQIIGVYDYRVDPADLADDMDWMIGLAKSEK